MNKLETKLILGHLCEGDTLPIQYFDLKLIQFRNTKKIIKLLNFLYVELQIFHGHDKIKFDIQYITSLMGVSKCVMLSKNIALNAQ